MLIGVSTDNFASRPTPLSQDIADLMQFNLKTIEIVPKTATDLQEGAVLKKNLKKFEYVAVLLPPPPVSIKKTPTNEISPYYQEAFQFSDEIGAQLIMIRPDFRGCESPNDVIQFLQPLLKHALNTGQNVAILNWFTPECQYGTFDQVTEVVKALNCKLAVDLGHAHLAMGSKSAWILGEQKQNIIAIRASDATSAFGDLPLGTGHVNYPMIMPLLEERGFTGPFFISQKRDPRPESILNSISFLEYFEI